MQEIKRVLKHTGSESEQYFDWVYEVNPPLPPSFEKRFKKTTRNLTAKLEKQSKKSCRVNPCEHECDTVIPTSSRDTVHTKCAIL